MPNGGHRACGMMATLQVSVPVLIGMPGATAMRDPTPVSSAPRPRCPDPAALGPRRFLFAAKIFLADPVLGFAQQAWKRFVPYQPEAAL